MAVLDKNTLQEYLDAKKIIFTPYPTESQFSPNSIDLRLGFEFMIPKTWRVSKQGREVCRVDIDQVNDNFDKVVLDQEQYFEIGPGEFIIGTTLEKVEFESYDYMAVLYPRSSINRRGLSVDLTGIVDSGYHGKLFIPIKNTTSTQIIRVYPGERFVQLVFYTLEKELSYEDCMKHGVSAPKYHQDAEDENIKFHFVPDGDKNK